MSKFCKNCGTEVAEGIGFCPKCGTVISDVAGYNGGTNVIPKEKGNGMAIAALVFGILSIVFCWFPVIGFLFELLAIFLGKFAKPSKMAKVGLIMGIIGFSLGILMLVFSLGAGIGYQEGYDVPWHEKIFN